MHGQVCEASGVHVTRNADGRATCPLCGDDWHVLTKGGHLRRHVFLRHLPHLYRSRLGRQTSSTHVR